MTIKHLLASALLVAATAGGARAEAQDHHCKLASGSFDGGKTRKQCEAAKGTWAKDAAFTGQLLTGVNAIGGETTGVVITASDKTTYELDLHGDKALTATATQLAKTWVTATGYLTIVHGVEIHERHVFVVSTLVAAAIPPPPPPPPSK